MLKGHRSLSCPCRPFLQPSCSHQSLTGHIVLLSAVPALPCNSVRVETLLQGGFADPTRHQAAPTALEEKLYPITNNIGNRFPMQKPHSDLVFFLPVSSLFDIRISPCAAPKLLLNCRFLPNRMGHGSWHQHQPRHTPCRELPGGGATWIVAATSVPSPECGPVGQQAQRATAFELEYYHERNSLHPVF